MEYPLRAAGMSLAGCGEPGRKAGGSPQWLG